jgi:hypothetical protein
MGAFHQCFDSVTDMADDVFTFGVSTKVFHMAQAAKASKKTNMNFFFIHPPI